MEAKEMAKNLKKTGVKNVTLNQMNIINCIKSGVHTSAEIAETLEMTEHVVKSILGMLIRNKVVEKTEIDGKSDTYMLVPTTSGKKIKLVGNLNFPVTSFTDQTGQRYVTRDTWHKIDDDIDVINDIEWEDSKSTQNQKLKEIMKESAKKQPARSRKGTLANEAPASEEQRKLISKSTIDFIILSGKFKMRVLSISAVNAVVVFSPRIWVKGMELLTTEQDGAIEFTHGLLTAPQTITVEELDDYLKGVKEPVFNKETVSGATDTCFIENDNTFTGEGIIRISVTRAMRGGKIELSKWLWTASTNGYKRLSAASEEITTEELLNREGAFTTKLFNK